MRWKVFLGLVFALFLGMLVGVYVIAKRSNPVMLDERGEPVRAPHVRGQ
jgi:hypothetical protein